MHIHSQLTNENNSIQTQKSSHLDLFDQQVLSKFDDSINDKQWHTVTSNKRHRKEIVSQLETSNKITKELSTNMSKYLVFILYK